MKEIGKLFLVFFKIGLFTFGGGFAMVPAIKREAVDVHGWVTEDEVMDCIAIGQSLPGVFSINSATFIGNRVKGLPGAVVACAGVTLPAFFAILIILVFLGKIEDNPYVLGALEGIKAASVALILVTVWNMGKTILKNAAAVVLSLISFLMIAVFGVNAVWAILFGAAWGYVAYRIRVFRERKAAKAGEDK